MKLSTSSKNILILAGGTTFAQAIPIAITPILTRLYTPEEFGIFALFLAISSTLSVIATLQYENAVILPKKDEDAINIIALGLIITLLTSILILIVAILYQDYFIKILHNSKIGPWLYWVPISVFFIGVGNLLTFFNNRKKFYMDIAAANILKSIVISILQIGMGIIKNGVMGLITGHVISQLAANITLLKNIFREDRVLARIKSVKIISVAKKYKNFPKFSMPAAVANVLSYQVMNILFPMFFNLAALGFYSIAQRVLLIPSMLIGNAISQVFLKEAVDEKLATGNAISTFKKTLMKLIIIAIPFFGILIFTVEDLFSLFLGDQWASAGEYAKILIPLYLLRFISSVCSAVIIVFEKQAADLTINLILLLVSLSAFIISDSLNQFMHLFSFSMAVCYFLFIMYYYKIARGE